MYFKTVYSTRSDVCWDYIQVSMYLKFCKNNFDNITVRKKVKIKPQFATLTVSLMTGLESQPLIHRRVNIYININIDTIINK